MHQFPSDLSDLVPTSLCCRPPDRRRRDVFGVANNTLFLEGGSRGNTTFGTGDNATESIPPVKHYPFSEGKSTVEFLEIHNLQPFTVYRIDLHACNEEVGHCSVGAFVYSRTKPAGSIPTLTPAHWALFRFIQKQLCVRFSQLEQTTSLGRWPMKGARQLGVVCCCIGWSLSCPMVSSWCTRSSSAWEMRCVLDTIGVAQPEVTVLLHGLHHIHYLSF